MFYETDTHDPRHIEKHGDLIGRDSIEKLFTIATSADEVISVIERTIGLGFDHIALALNGDFPAFLKAAQERILPYFREKYERGNYKEGGYRGAYDQENLRQLLEAKNLSHKVKA